MNDNNILAGQIIEVFPDTKFKVKLDNFDKVVFCCLSGKMRVNKIKCLMGDFVELVLSPDKTIGRITKRK